MDSIYIINLKSLIVFAHLAGLALGVGGAWILDLYILRKMYSSPVTQENIQIISFVSKVVVIGLLILWFSGLSLIVFYYFMQPEMLLNQKIWAKLVIVIVLTINGYYLHEYVLPLILNNRGRVLIRAISLKQINIMTIVGCISCITWPLVMFLGVFRSLNFMFSFFEIIGIYLLVLFCSLVTAYVLKNYLIEKEMGRKIRVLNQNLTDSKKQLDSQTRELRVLSKVLKQR